MFIKKSKKVCLRVVFRFVRSNGSNGYRLTLIWLLILLRASAPQFNMRIALAENTLSTKNGPSTVLFNFQMAQNCFSNSTVATGTVAKFAVRVAVAAAAVAAAAAAHAHGCPIRTLNSKLIHTFHQLYYNNKHCKISEILTYTSICRPDHLH